MLRHKFYGTLSSPNRLLGFLKQVIEISTYKIIAGLDSMPYRAISLGIQMHLRIRQFHNVKCILNTRMIVLWMIGYVYLTRYHYCEGLNRDLVRFPGEASNSELNCLACVVCSTRSSERLGRRVIVRLQHR